MIKNLAERVLKKNIKKISLIKYLSFGNKIYRIATSKEDYIIKLYNKRNPKKDFITEKSALDIINRSNLKAPKLIYAKKEDNKLPSLIIISEINGRPLMKDNHILNTKIKDFSEVGKLFSELHSINYKKNYEPSLDLAKVAKDKNNWLGFIKNQCKKELKKIKKREILDQENINKIEELLKKIRGDKFKVCLIHGDSTLKGVLANENKIMGMIDFERAHYGDAIFDFVKIEDDLAEHPNLKKTFIKGYFTGNNTKRESYINRLNLYRILKILRQLNYSPKGITDKQFKRHILPYRKRLVKNLDYIFSRRDKWIKVYPLPLPTYKKVELTKNKIVEV